MPGKKDGELYCMPELADKKKCDKYIDDLCNCVDVDFEDFEDESKFTFDELYYIGEQIKDILDNDTRDLTNEQGSSLVLSSAKIAEIGLEWAKYYDKILSEGQEIRKKITKGGPTFN